MDSTHGCNGLPLFTLFRVVGPSIKLHEEIIYIENNAFNNPNRQEADQPSIYKPGRGVGRSAAQTSLVTLPP